MTTFRQENEVGVPGELAVPRHLGTSRAQWLALDQLPQGATRVTSAAALLADPPEWATDELGQVPVTGPGRRRAAQRAAHVEDCCRRSNGAQWAELLRPGRSGQNPETSSSAGAGN